MPKVKIDYSNTIFYKILCNDTSVKDLYIGHTTNFVQRKYAHKQGCINPKSVNYNCKVYETIRDNMGWDNWTMEIIAFHNCEDLYSAKKQEQHYFEEYKATLNSIEPSPPRKPKKEVVARAKREVLYCSSCRVYFNTRKLQEEHNKRPRHLKMIRNETERTPNPITKFECEKCNFKCCKKKDYNRHLLTAKHIKMTNNDKNTSNLPIFSCECGKQYKYRQGLHYHKKNCDKLNEEYTKDTNDSPSVQVAQVDSSLLIELLKQNQELKELIIEQHKRMTEQQDTIIDSTLKRILG
jgi:hypothetical protein